MSIRLQRPYRSRGIDKNRMLTNAGVVVLLLVMAFGIFAGFEILYFLGWYFGIDPNNGGDLHGMLTIVSFLTVGPLPCFLLALSVYYAILDWSYMGSRTAEDRFIYQMCNHSEAMPSCMSDAKLVSIHVSWDSETTDSMCARGHIIFRKSRDHWWQIIDSEGGKHLIHKSKQGKVDSIFLKLPRVGEAVKGLEYLFEKR